MMLGGARAMGTLGAVATLAIGVVAATGCHHRVPDPVPGDTDRAIAGVSFRPAPNTALSADYEPLKELLGVRKGNPLIPARNYNRFRIAEDRKRVVSYLRQRGYFDAIAAEPEIVRIGDEVSVTWTVHEGPKYTIGSVHLEKAPADAEGELRKLIPFAAGDDIDLELYRPLRRRMAEKLQDFGYGHARVYSRAFVDRERRKVAWYYYVDAGPRTRIGKVAIEGNERVPESVIRERLGFVAGKPFSRAAARQAELALLDTGAFAAISVQTNADILRGPPEYPNTGGALSAEQVSADGELIPRQLDPTLDVTVKVVEAPSRQVRLEAGVEGDPSRLDSYAGARIWLRHFFGSQHHLAIDGNAGYGWLWGGDDDQPSGVHGFARVRTLHPGLLGPRLDARTTVQYREALYPTALLREGSAGPGARATLGEGVFFDVDLFYRYARSVDFGPFADGDMDITARGLALSEDATARGARGEAALIVDRRNDGLEPTSGYFGSARLVYSPGGALGTHRYLSIAPELRGFVPISASWSLAARGSADFATLAGDRGLPLEARLFGGGAYGHRGFGRQQLAPELCMAGVDDDCEKVGGRSQALGSLEARYLPFRGLIGLSAFADVGNVGAGLDPFENGVSAAVGLGARLRSWYVPIAIDISTRVVEDSASTDLGSLDPYLVFVRIGEAF